MQPTTTFPRIQALFATAAPRLKKPRITLEHAGYTFRLELHPSGAVKILRLADGDRKYPQGWINADGTLSTFNDKVRAMVAELEKDPVPFITAAGRAAGRCCFCRLVLTDDHDGFSVRLGYGPVCARQWGLPHGVDPVAKEEAFREQAEQAAAEFTPELMYV